LDPFGAILARHVWVPSEASWEDTFFKLGVEVGWWARVDPEGGMGRQVEVPEMSLILISMHPDPVFQRRISNWILFLGLEGPAMIRITL
jgi:hypothetical protein